MDITAAKETVVRAGKSLVEHELVSRTWGNVSCRVDENRFAITPSGMGYDRVTVNDIVVVNMHTLTYEGTVKPSSEKGVHAAAYRLRPDIRFVIHTHQTCATAMSLPDTGILSLDENEQTALGGSVLRAGYGLPGSKRLCRNVEEQLRRGTNAILMERHGALLLGGSMEEAFLRAALLERACQRFLPRLSSPAVPRPADCSWEQDFLGALEGRLSQSDVVILRRAPVFSLLDGETRLPAMIDDFAQMAGRDAKIITRLQKNAEQTALLLARALRGRNCAILRGIGAVCREKTLEDAEAVSHLAEKNALTYFAAKAHGAISPLPLPDALLMRIVYQLKYSKKK